MSKRPEPNSQDMWSQGDRNYGKVKNETDTKGDSENNSLQYFIEREKTIQLLKKKGIKSLYPIQQQTFRRIYQGEDILARDRTGSGKTMAFVLPVIERFRNSKFQHRYPKFLIILPTRELAIQVHNEIESLRYRDQDDFISYVVYGKTSIEDNLRRMKDGVDILVATPGRLNDLIEKGSVRLNSIEVICLDEADQILKQGFKQEIEKVFFNMKKVNKNKVQVLLFSATIPQWLKGLSEEYQTRDRPYINLISDDQTRSSKTIKHLCCQISRLGGSEVIRLIEHMVDKYGGNEKRVLIFCDRKAQVEDLSKDLSIPNQPLHGDVHQSRRERAYRDFKSGMLKCIVATNVAARGLDFPHVDLVIQMTPPINTEEYIHRSGRTGRAGKQGTCLTFFDRTKSRIISKIEDQAKITIQKITVDTNSFSGDKGFQDRNERYDRGGRQQRGDKYDRNDRFERNDRNERNCVNERRENGRGDRNDFQSRGNRYGDRDRQESGNGRDFGRSNNYGGDNRDPRPRPFYNEGRDNRGFYTVGQKQSRSRSNSAGKNTGKKNRSISNSRSVSKERSTSPRRQRSPSPRRQISPSPKKDYGSRPVSRPSQQVDDCDY